MPSKLMVQFEWLDVAGLPAVSFALAVDDDDDDAVDDVAGF